MNYSEFAKMNEQGRNHWWYNARREILEHELSRYSSGNSQQVRILDMASACGYNLPTCARHGMAFGIDLSEYAIMFCKQKNLTRIVQGDVQYLPYADNTFDIVVALDVFEHIKEDVASMKEIARILKKGGKLILNVPAFMSLFSYHDEAFEHLRRYRANEIKEKLRSVNLQVNFLSYWSFFIFPIIFLMRKVIPGNNKDGKDNLSDFYRNVPFLVEKILIILNFVELRLIKRKISLPFGVSLYGIAQK